MKNAEGKDIEVLGFNIDADRIIFFVENNQNIFEYVVIDSSLKKIQLISELNISPSIINKKLKDEILEEARKGGKFRRVYSFDNIKFMRSSEGVLKLGTCNYPRTEYINTKYHKYVRVSEFEDYPLYLSQDDLLEVYKERNKPKIEKICNI